MRIVFDHQAFCLQTTGGISRYFCRLAQELTTLGQEVKVIAPLYRNQYLNTTNVSILGHYIKKYPLKTAGVLVTINGFVARQLIKKSKPDIVHETYFSRHRSGQAKKPTVLTVFDMISELSELQIGKKTLGNIKISDKYAAVSRADHIICISEHTRQDLMRLFNVPETKTSVVYLGCDDMSDISIPSIKIPPFNRPFLLYVGNRGGYKNFKLLLQAFASSRQIINDFDIISFGGGAFNHSELSFIKSLGLEPERIRQTNGNDQELGLLYKHATALIYPSAYEGFGLPPLEAMAQGCPVISSNVSSMPEIIGNAAYYFNPTSIDDLAHAIKVVAYSSDITQDLIRKGKIRHKLFTWDRCALDTLNIYRNLSKCN